MFDTIFDLPVHILTVHAAVVVLPLAAVASALVVLRPRLPLVVPLLVLALDAGAVVLALVARESGQVLFARLGQPAAAADHVDFGNRMPWFAAALLLVTAGWAVVRRRGALAVVTALAVLVVAAATGYWAIRTGHTGSAAVWGPIVENTTAP